MNSILSETPVRISVVIPTYNRERLIGRAIRCVLEQAYGGHEVVVVDDGSTDGTAGVVAEYGSGVRFVRQNHAGPSRARNRGVEEATGAWIAFLDSDDLWYPDYLGRMASAIHETSGAAALYFSDVAYPCEPSPTTHWAISGYNPGAPLTLISPNETFALREIHPMLLPFTVFRRDVYTRYGGLWEELMSAEDTHLFIRMALHETSCAVGGVGGIVTGDEDDPANRLTIAYGTGTARRWRGMVRMYQHLLGTELSVSSKALQVLNRRLAHSYWRLARLGWREGHNVEAFSSLLLSLRTNPLVVPSVLVDALLRALGRT